MDDQNIGKPRDDERGDPKSKTKKRILIAALSVLALGLLATVGMNVTSQPNFCNSCHEISPAVAAWSNGPHNNVKCLKCHSNPGTVGYVSRKIKGLNELYLHFTNQIPADIEAKFNTASCVDCHTRSNYPNAKNIQLTSGDLAPSFPHADILKNNTSCLDCHQNIGHKF